MTLDMLYTKEWLDNERKRFKDRKKFQHPLLYRFATETRFDYERDIYQKWLQKVNNSDRKILINKLRNYDQFNEARNELKVAGRFIDFGCSVRYELNLKNITPDWFVFSPYSQQSFIIEVFTSNIDEKKYAYKKSILKLRDRLNEIEIDARIRVRVRSGEKPLSDNDVKDACIKVSEWLKGKSAKENDELKIKDVQFMLSKRDSGYLYLQCIVSGLNTWVTTDEIKKNCIKKANRYKKLSVSRNLPFIIAVIPAFETGRGTEELAKICYGHQNLSFKKFENICIINSQNDLINNCLFVERPEISASIMVNDLLNIDILLNPFAINPVQIEMFN